MADFRPETNIYLFEGTGVDDGNQPYFESQGAKMAWYMAHPTIEFTAQSYQRENRNWCRLSDKAERFRHCDMMAFQNGDGKWVLCRVDEVEFVNPNCTDISYTVDYMQTYIEDIKFGKCFVEREMQDDDWFGDEPSFNNLQPEGLETGPLKRSRVSSLDDFVNFDTFDLIVVSAYDVNGDENYRVRVNGNYPSGLNYIKFRIAGGDMGALSTMLQTYAEKGRDLSTSIVGMFICPYQSSEGIFSSTASVSKPFPRIDGVTVNNSKCFSGEFFRLEISNRRGAEQELKLENFTEITSIRLDISGGFGAGSGGMLLYPHGYEGNPRDYGVIRYDDAQCPFVGNAFSAWLGANLGKLAITSAVGAGSALFGAVSGSPAGVGMGVSTLTNNVGKIIEASKNPSSVGGQVAGSVIELLIDNYGFSVSWLHPYAPNIKVIDDYFSTYGYRTNRFKVPNVNSRPKWNYVKTANAVCRGWFSKKAQLEMERIMNAGVTFWHLSPGEEITNDWDPAVNKQ